MGDGGGWEGTLGGVIGGFTIGLGEGGRGGGPFKGRLFRFLLVLDALRKFKPFYIVLLQVFFRFCKNLNTSDIHVHTAHQF